MREKLAHVLTGLFLLYAQLSASTLERLVVPPHHHWSCTAGGKTGMIFLLKTRTTRALVSRAVMLYMNFKLTYKNKLYECLMRTTLRPSASPQCLLEQLVLTPGNPPTKPHSGNRVNLLFTLLSRAKGLQE